MDKPGSDFFRVLCEKLIFLVVALLFSSLGSDTDDMLRVRMAIGALLAAAFSALVLTSRKHHAAWNVPVLCLLLLLLFQALRTAALQFHHPPNILPDDFTAFKARSLESLIRWGYLTCFFWIGYSFFRTRVEVQKLLNLMGWCGFFIALNSASVILMTGETHYKISTAKALFFHPVFYFQDWIGRYVLGTFGHPNYVGDVMALGFFASLAMTLYSLSHMSEMSNSGNEKQDGGNTIAYALLRFLFVLVAAAGVVLQYSRGTIFCFVIGFSIFLFLLLVKYPSVKHFLTAGVMILSLTGFLFWAGNIDKVWKEVQTLDSEIRILKGDEKTEGSISANRQGAKLAVSMYRDHALWGVGSRGYRVYVDRYAGKDYWDVIPMIQAYVMCHYLQVMAEEGAGAYLYFLFIGSYFIAALAGLLKTQSRFKFITGSALASAVAMVHLHAVFNHLMEQFSMSLLVFMVMGASLAALHKDFAHHEAN